MPSVVSVDEDGNVLVGNEACEVEACLGAYRNVKRVIGTGGYIKPDIATVVPRVKPNPNGMTYKKNSLDNQMLDADQHPTMLQTLDGKGTISPEMISSCIIQKLKAAAEYHLKKPVTRAVVGVPAYFHDKQREATQRAVELAGIPKVKLLREPEAAAFAYGIGRKQAGIGDEDELVLVFDLGGGTFDVSVLVVGGGVSEVICTSGNVQLGGSDFDFKVARHLVEVLGAKQWKKAARDAVVRAAEAIRIHLSNNRRANLCLPAQEEAWLTIGCFNPLFTNTDIAANMTDGITRNETHINYQFTRAAMERLCQEEFQALLRPVREVAIMAGALLPGDTSPTLVENALEMEEVFQVGQRDSAQFDDFYKDDDPVDAETLLELQEQDMMKAKKAQQRGRRKARNIAKQERKFRQEKRKVQEQAASGRSLDGTKVRDGISGRPISRVVLVGGATRMPGVGKLLEALTGVRAERTVNPDEAVALGCAVHVGVLDGKGGMGTVLNPLQAAILRAIAEQQAGIVTDESEFDSDADELGEAEYF